VRRSLAGQAESPDAPTDRHGELKSGSKSGRLWISRHLIGEALAMSLPLGDPIDRLRAWKDGCAPDYFSTAPHSMPRGWRSGRADGKALE